MREQTWFAVVVCTIGVIPGFIVGGLFKILMYVFGGWAENSDFLYLHRLFGFEAPGALYNFIFANALPNGFQALTAGFVAVWIMEKIARGSHYGLAAMITGALYTGFLVCLIILSFANFGITSESFSRFASAWDCGLDLGALPQVCHCHKRPPRNQKRLVHSASSAATARGL